MIAINNLNGLNVVLLQEELLQAKTQHFCNLVTDKKIANLLESINKDSIKHHEEIIKYVEGHL